MGASHHYHLLLLLVLLLLPLPTSTTSTGGDDSMAARLAATVDAELMRVERALASLARVCDTTEMKYTSSAGLAALVHHDAAFEDTRSFRDSDIQLLDTALFTDDSDATCPCDHARLWPEAAMLGVPCNRVCHAGRFVHVSALLTGPVVAMLTTSQLFDSLWFTSCPGLLSSWPKGAMSIAGDTVCSSITGSKLAGLVVGNVSCQTIGTLTAHIARSELQRLLEQGVTAETAVALVSTRSGTVVAATQQWQHSAIASLECSLPLNDVSGARLANHADFAVYVLSSPSHKNFAKVLGICLHGLVIAAILGVIAGGFAVSKSTAHNRESVQASSPAACTTMAVVCNVIPPHSRSPQSCRRHTRKLPQPLNTQLDSWDFDVQSIAGNGGSDILLRVAYETLENKGIVDFFRLNRGQLCAFLRDLEAGYIKANPYHNAEHAADVTQAMYALLNAAEAPFTEVELFAALFAAMAHDYKHPGVSNAFLVNTRHPLSLRYNATSVLESMHAAESLTLLLSSAHSSLISSLPAGVFNEFYNIVVTLILATDMSRHVEITTQFSALLRSGEFNATNKHHRLSLLKIFIKLADISNPTRQWSTCFMWAQRVMAEFWNQGDQEKALCIPVSPYMDRDSTIVAQSQSAFAEFVAAPMAEIVSKMVRPDFAATLLKNIQFNTRKWKEMSTAQHH